MNLQSSGRRLTEPTPYPPFRIPPPPPPTSINKDESCIYCGDTEDTNFIVSGYAIENSKENIHMSAFVHRNMMIFSANYLILEVPIRFCPMCGRKLNHEIK